MTSSIVDEAKEFKAKHEEEIRRLYEAFGNSGGSIAANVHIRSLIQLVYQFMVKYKHTNYDDKQECRTDIEAVIDEGFDIPLEDEEFEKVIEGVASRILKKKPSISQQTKQQAKQTKKQEVKQYPPRYTTSKPSRPKDMTTTYRPKLNLSHIQQVHQPASVLPSENTRKKAKGQIQGLEEDGRIWNSEKNMYVKAWEKLGNEANNQLSKNEHRIHATGDVRAAVKRLAHGKAISKHLTSWR